MPDALRLKLAPRRKSAAETLRLKAVARVARDLAEIRVAVDGEQVCDCLWEAGCELELRFPVPPSACEVAVFLPAGLPAGALTLPGRTAAIAGALPPLVAAATGEPSRVARIWNPQTPPQGLRHLPEALFAANQHLEAVTGTFAGLAALEAVPENLFRPLARVSTFAACFQDSGLASVPAGLFAAALQAEDFSSVFKGCARLKSVPPGLFAACPRAFLFDKAFAGSGLEAIPAELFAAVAKGGSYEQTFARCPVREVPAGLMTGREPVSVDGMFEPLAERDHDPMRLKAAPKFYPGFLEDVRMADGVPTCRTR